MEAVYDRELIESMKDRLSNTVDIILSSHTVEHFKEQTITEEQIKDVIWNPKKLLYVEQQPDEMGEKYKLIFHRSGKYDFVIVVLFNNNHLKVITSRIQNKKRLRLVDQWNKRVVRQ